MFLKSLKRKTKIGENFKDRAWPVGAFFFFFPAPWWVVKPELISLGMTGEAVYARTTKDMHPCHCVV